MKNRRLITSIATLMMIVVVLVGAMPAFATPPDRFTRPSAATFVLAECDGFDIINDRSDWVTFTDFYDNDGDLERSTLHATLHSRIYNSVTGFEVKNTLAFNQEVNPDQTEYFIRGVAYNITVPGYGIVHFDAGLGIFVVVDDEFVELKFAGNYVDDTDYFCEAMNQG